MLRVPTAGARITGEQRAAFEEFQAIAAPLRLRVVADAEGFPIARGRYGQIEWYCAGTVAIHSRTMRMLAKLTRLPSVRRHQVGDGEFRLLLPMDKVHDSAALGAVATLLRIRRRRLLSERQKLALLHGGRPFHGLRVPVPRRTLREGRRAVGDRPTMTVSDLAREAARRYVDAVPLPDFARAILEQAGQPAMAGYPPFVNDLARVPRKRARGRAGGAPDDSRS